MLSPRNNNRITAHTKALEAAVLIINLLDSVGGSLKSVADQGIRAAASVPLNLAEAEGINGRGRRNSRQIAYAEALEAATAVQLLMETNRVDRDRAQAALNLLDEARARTWRLMNPR